MSDISVDGVPASGAPFQIGVALSKTFSVFGSKFVSFAILAFLTLIPLLAVTVITPDGPGAAAWGGLASILTFILTILAQASTLYGAFQQMAGKPFSMAQSLRAGFGRALPVFGVALLAALFTVLAAILLFVPGIIVFCMLYVAVPICVIEKLGVMASLDRSAKLTKGSRWQIFGMLLLVAIVNIAVHWFLARLGGVTLFGKLLTFGWQVIATSFGAVMVAVVYHDLRVAKEGMDFDHLANVFD